MISLSDHVHLDTTSPLVKPQRKTEFSSKLETEKYFREELSRSEMKLGNDTKIHISRMREIRQKKIYAGLDISPIQYLFILFEERRHNMGEMAEAMQQVLWKKKRKVLNDLVKDNLSIETMKSTYQIQAELAEQLEILRLKSPEKKLPHQDSEQKKLEAEEKIQKYMEFRKKSYWKMDNQQTEQVKVFIKKLRQKQSKQHSRYETNLKKQEQLHQSERLSLNKQRQMENRKLKQELHHDFSHRKQQKLKEEQSEKKKIQEIQQFLQKFRQKPPNYIIFSQRYKRKQQQHEKEKKQFLKQLKESKRHSSLSEIRDQMKKYDELKQMRHQQKEQQKRLQSQKQLQIKQQLQKFYKSKHRSRSVIQIPSTPEKKKMKHQQMLKRIIYSKKMQEEHPPIISQQKREELINEINELKKKEDHKIRKYRDGQQVVIDKSELDPRKKGLQYLQQVKKITSLIQRKPPVSQQPEGEKLIDKSRKKNSFYHKKVTISNWKEVLQNQKLNQQQKNEKIQIFLDLANQHNQSHMQNQRKSSPQRSFQLQKQIDHYQIEKAKAKLALLKSLK